MRNVICFLLILFSVHAYSQSQDPIRWTTSINKISDTEYELVATATIQPSWNLYAQSVPEGGPVPTSFTYENNPSYTIKGETTEEEGNEVDDQIFGMRIKLFQNKADFKQRIEVKNNKAFKIEAAVQYMACNDSQCLPPKQVDLIFEVKKL